MKGHVEEENYKDDDDSQRDEPSGKGRVGRSTIVANELSIAEEIEEFEELVDMCSTRGHVDISCRIIISTKSKLINAGRIIILIKCL